MPQLKRRYRAFQRRFVGRQVAGESIQLKGTIRRTSDLDAFPCQRQPGSLQEISSFPNICMASISESEGRSHLFCKLMLWWPLGHLKTIW